jgi:Ricin-type beta-trefoil lectin domain-like
MPTLRSLTTCARPLRRLAALALAGLALSLALIVGSSPAHAAKRPAAAPSQTTKAPPGLSPHTREMVSRLDRSLAKLGKRPTLRQLKALGLTVRVLHRSAHRPRHPKRAQRRPVRLTNRSAHAADAYTPFTIKLAPTNTIVGQFGLDLVLDVSGASTSPGAPVINYWDKSGFSTDANQYWTVYPFFGYQWYYYIVNQNSGQCLTSDGVAGDQVYQWPCVGSPYQQWTRNEYDVGPSGPDFGSRLADTWQSVASGLYLDVSQDSPWPGAAIDTWYWNGGANQYFYET